MKAAYKQNYYYLFIYIFNPVQTKTQKHFNVRTKKSTILGYFTANFLLLPQIQKEI